MTDDDLLLVRELLGDPSRQGDRGLDLARARLDFSMRANPARTRALRPGRRRLGVLAAASVTITAALVTVLVGMGPGGGQLPTENLAAAATLDNAARQAMLMPQAAPSSGQYLYIETAEGHLEDQLWNARIGKPISARYSVSDTRQVWIAPDGSGRTKVAFQPVTFVSPADRARWQASGVPDPTPTSQDHTYAASSIRQGNYLDSGGLPTDPTALRSAIVDRYEGGKPDIAATFSFAANLLEQDASPAQRAALYRVVSELPGVGSLGPTADRTGRSGVAVTLTQQGVRTELIFDPVSTRVLEVRRVIVNPADRPGSAPNAPSGTELSYQLYLATGIVDSTTQAP